MSHSNRQPPQSPRARPPLSPVFDPKASSTRPRLYGNKVQHHTRSNEISHFKNVYIEENNNSSSNDINTFVKYNSTRPLSPKTNPDYQHTSARERALRNIFSPIPKPEVNDDLISPLECCSPTVYVPSTASNSKQNERRSSDIIFPAIKVDSYCDDGTTWPTAANIGRLSVTEKRSRSTGNLFMGESISDEGGFHYRDNINNYNSNHSSNNSAKCLMVPPTLVRTRSTDGRLMVGTKDRSLFPTISKAWSKSDGNFFSDKSNSTSSISTTAHTSNQRLRRPDSFKSKSNEIKPENTDFHFDELRETKSYKKLGPILSSATRTDTILTDSFSPGNNNASKSFCTVSSLSNRSSPAVTLSGISVSENDISIFQKNKPVLLNVFDDPNEGSFSPKQQRSKSHSPRRRCPSPANHPKERTLLGEERCQSSIDARDECGQTKNEKPDIPFLSTQPRPKLGPIHGDKSNNI